MSTDRPWYREPETFIALAALVVSVSAVAIGLYEASLQRAHDRAEVWPRVEISTYVTQTGGELWLQNTGIGPALIKSVVVAVDGKRQRSWDEVLRTLYGREPPVHSSSSTVEHALRAGDRTTMVGLAKADMPPGFWPWIARVSVRVCYSSVFNEYWTVGDDHLGGTSKWREVSSCPPQAAGTDF